jgi:hypothetical protein
MLGVMCKKMKNTVLIIAILLISNAAYSEQKYASVTTMFDDETCIVFSWIPVDGKRTKIEYKNKAKKSHGIYGCEVSIPIQEFEKIFEVCYLAGFSNTRDGFEFRKPFGAGFYGGAANGRDDIYWFQWSDAEYTHAQYRCLLNTHNKANQHGSP